MDCVLAVDLGGTKILSALVGPGERILKIDQRPTEASLGQERVIANLLESVAAVMPGEEQQVNLLGAAVAAPGPLNPCSGRVIYSPNLDWHDVNLREKLEVILKLPVLVENDANLAALGEYLFGAGRGYDHMVFITVSTGVGGGLILNGEIYSGAYGCGGELGHMLVAPEGALCSCGNRGCLEAMASGLAVSRRARELVRAGRGKRLLELARGDEELLDARLVTRAAREGDAEALAILAEAGRFLGMAIASVANLLNPAAFVIGGGVARGAGALLLEPAEEEARRHIFPGLGCYLKILPSALQGRGGVLGAAAYAWRRFGSGS